MLFGVHLGLATGYLAGTIGVGGFIGVLGVILEVGRRDFGGRQATRT
jgi:hypothetical protein